MEKTIVPNEEINDTKKLMAIVDLKKPKLWWVGGVSAIM